MAPAIALGFREVYIEWTGVDTVRVAALEVFLGI